MALDRVRAYLRTFGAEERILEFPVSSATVALAAQALGCEEARIAKTLSFAQGEGCILVVAAGDAKVDNDAERLVGHAVGGVCPFGVNAGVPVYLDESLRRFETVFPACGSANSAIELTLDELERFSNAEGWVDVCKGWQKA